MSNLNELKALLDDGLITDRDVIEGYRRDRTAWAEVGEPLAVVRPGTTAEVQAIARWSTRQRVHWCRAAPAAASRVARRQAMAV
jgi:glycolate oxidase